MFSKKLVKKLTKKLKQLWKLDRACKSLDVLGAGLLVTAIWLAFGAAPAVALAGITLIVVGYSLE